MRLVHAAIMLPICSDAWYNNVVIVRVTVLLHHLRTVPTLSGCRIDGVTLKKGDAQKVAAVHKQDNRKRGDHRTWKKHGD